MNKDTEDRASIPGSGRGPLPTVLSRAEPVLSTHCFPVHPETAHEMTADPRASGVAGLESQEVTAHRVRSAWLPTSLGGPARARDRSCRPDARLTASHGSRAGPCA